MKSCNLRKELFLSSSRQNICLFWCLGASENTLKKCYNWSNNLLGFSEFAGNYNYFYWIYYLLCDKSISKNLLRVTRFLSESIILPDHKSDHINTWITWIRLKLCILSYFVDTNFFYLEKLLQYPHAKVDYSHKGTRESGLIAFAQFLWCTDLFVKRKDLRSHHSAASFKFCGRCM